MIGKSSDQHIKKHLVLVGGGHAHLVVLEHLSRQKNVDIEITLITPSPWQYYSGMLPGWISGYYAEADCRIDIRPLAARAGVRLILEPVVAMNADDNLVFFADGRQLGYDLLSLDTGSESNNEQLASLGAKLLPAKPLDAFYAAFPQVMAQARAKDNFQLAVIGGGAGGVELALAASHALRKVKNAAPVTLVAGRSGLLAGHGSWTQRRVRRALEQAAINVIFDHATGTTDGVDLSNGQHLRADCVIAATGARAARWLATSRLSLDKSGFVDVDAFHQSLSHNNVFAVGDVCARVDRPVARSGVHAVHAGPVVAHNLMARLRNKPLRAYHPRRWSLYILATGAGRAIASYGVFSVEGRWVWRWKDAIDRKFIHRFRVDRVTD